MSDLCTDSSCWCSTLGPVPSCRACQQRQHEPPQLSQEIRKQLASAPADLIMMESESRKRKAATKIGFREGETHIVMLIFVKITMNILTGLF